MTATWLHVTVVHLPVVLAPTALCVLAATRCGRSDTALRIAAWMLAAAAASSLAAYFSGGPSFEALEGILEGTLVDRHAQSAQIAMIATVVTGGLALKALMGFLQEEPPGGAFRATLLGAALVCSWRLARAAHLGGVLRHPEAAGPSWLETILFY